MEKNSLIEAKFIRAKVQSKNTMLWRDMDIYRQEIMLGKSNLKLDEILQICFFENESHWWILTNIRILGYQGTIKFIYVLSDLIETDLTTIFNEEVGKKEYSTLDLHFRDRFLKLNVEKGTWPILYLIFKFIISLNKSGAR